MRGKLFGLAMIWTIGLAHTAIAAPVPSGTVSGVATFNPAVNLSTNPSTYSAMNGSTYEISGTGGFATIGKTTGNLNGMITFSNVVGTVVTQTLPDFFVFSDGSGGTYNFSASSVRTNTFSNDPASSYSTLYLLGNVVGTSLGFTSPTLASLSLQFNSTGGSSYSSALTLAVPPAGSAVPEPAGWAMLVAGVGVMGATLRYARRRSKVIYG